MLDTVTASAEREAGCWMLEGGCWKLDGGIWMLEVGYWILEFSFFSWSSSLRSRLWREQHEAVHFIN